MATFVLCTRCGKVQEIAAIDEFPEGWRRAKPSLLCPRCADTSEDEVIGDVLDEEVICPQDDTIDDNFDEGYCKICRGPCQGH